MAKKIAMFVVALVLVIGVSVGTSLLVDKTEVPTSTTIENGLSAYELAVQYGYEGTIQEWIESLNGKSAYQIAKENGYTGTETEWLASLKATADNAATIKEAEFNSKGELILTLSDNTVLNVGAAVGTNGKDGTDGKDGKDGKDGVGIANTAINENDQLVITYSDGRVVNLDKLVGLNGKDGVGISKSEINASGELVITYTNGQTANLGVIIGANGQNGTNGTDGKDGEDGKDGKDGVSITGSTINAAGELVITYSDNTTDNLGKIVGADGKNGTDGISVINAQINSEGELVLIFSNDQRVNVGAVVGAAGKDGVDGAPGEDGDDGVSVVKSEINSKGELVITYSDNRIENLGKVVGRDGAKGDKGDTGATGATGAQGEQGVQGEKGDKGDKGDTGATGATGVGIQNIAISAEGNLQIVLTNGTSMDLGNIKGADGVDGAPGKNGVDGAPGQAGEDGRGIANTSINNQGELIITYTDNTSDNLGKITGEAVGIPGTPGQDGAPGQDGRGIVNTEIDENGNLIITYTDNTYDNLGKVIGATGAKGDQGEKGEQGIQGEKGDKGEAGADGVGITMAQIDEEGRLVLYFSNNTSINLGKIVGDKGETGATGAQGAQGEQGVQGEKGADGVGIENVTVSASGELSVKLTSGTVLNLGNVKGADGLGVQKTEINDEGHLIITYTDDAVVDLGKVVGRDGSKGDKGDTGATGAQGDKGDAGVGIAAVNVSADGQLTMTLTDNTFLNLGNIRGPQGEKGDKGDKGDTGATGPQGPAGEDGQPGKDGTDGKTPYIKDGYWWIGDTNTNVKAEGTDGKDGQNGTNGTNGQNGTNGVSVVDAYVDENLHLWIVLSNGTKIDAGYVGVPTGPVAPTTYTVTFKDWNGNTLKTETVESGKAATAPADPSRTGYVFTGWDVAFNNVTTNLTVTAQYAVESTDPAFVLSDVTARAGETNVVVTVSVKNNPGILGAIFSISYDNSVLTLTGASNGVTANGVSYTPPAQYKNPTTFVWDAQDLTWTEDGVILTLTFSVSNTAANGDYAVTLNYDPYDVFDENGDPINFVVTNATVEVQ